MEQHEIDALNNEINTLRQELSNYRTLVDKCNAEKLALDGMYGQMIQECHKHRSESVYKESEIFKLRQQIENLKQEIENHKNEINNLKAANNPENVNDA